MPQDRSKAYADAGVDIRAADQLVDRIKGIVQATHTKGVISDIGGFGGLFKLDTAGMEEPVLVSGTDGVGTKLKLGFAFDGHATVGIDLVAMSVNDILVQGAKPLFFLDYFATGKLDVGVAEQVVKGIADGCKEAECALLGGETAEMPSMYPDGEYDLAGFCVGLVDNAKIVDGSGTRVGDHIIGLASSGLHSNGYSLVRKIVDESGVDPNQPLPGMDVPARKALMQPTAIYVKAVRNILRDFEVKGMVHVTGGGFYDNIPRVLPKAGGGVQARIKFGSWEVLPVFKWLRDAGELSWPEMLQIFNCGVGYCMIVGKNVSADVLDRLAALDMPAWKIGEIEAYAGDERVVVDF